MDERGTMGEIKNLVLEISDIFFLLLLFFK